MAMAPKPQDKAKRRRGSVPDGRQAALLAAGAQAREEEASFIFHKYDLDKNNAISEEELAICFSELAVKVNGRHRKTPEEVREWVSREFKRNDANKDGELSFDEIDAVLRHIGLGARAPQIMRHACGSAALLSASPWPLAVPCVRRLRVPPRPLILPRS